MNHKKVLIVEDDDSLREALFDTLVLANIDCLAASNAEDALKIVAENSLGMVISDVNMKPMNGLKLLKMIGNHQPDVPVLLITAYGDVKSAVQAMRDGAVDYLLKPFQPEVLVNLVNRYVLSEGDNEHGPVIADPTTKALFSLAKRVANSDATVLITGESGTGKEVLARFIHSESSRRDKPFVAINCAAIPENMLEATLFGYEKGAFTGAYQSSPGKFEQAQEGTLLLDEISEMDLLLQAKILRVLQEKEVERLAGKKTIPLNVRVLATSNRDLSEEVAAGRFREDLYYRLNVFPIHALPLRERREDILPLAESFISRCLKSKNSDMVKIDEDASQLLIKHDWKGNVRELDNLVQRALILQTGDSVTSNDIHFALGYADNKSISPEQTGFNGIVSEISDTKDSFSELAFAENDVSLEDNLKNKEANLIMEALQEFSGNRKKTAIKLGISERTLRYKLAKIKEQGVDIPKSLGVGNA